LALTPVAPATVVGTASATFVATGVRPVFVGGWRIAHVVDERRLKRLLAVVLVVVGPHLVLSA
jgi:hypothetical protein